RPEGTVFGFSPPAIPGLGVAGGGTFFLRDRADKGGSFFAGQVNKVLSIAPKRPGLGRVATNPPPAIPQTYVAVDKDKTLKQGVALNDVYNTLQSFLGGSFINYFNRFGRQWQVYVQAEDQFRKSAEQVGQFYVRNNQNEAVPLSALIRVE